MNLATSAQVPHSSLRRRAHSRPARCRKLRGFTLIELLVVVGIIIVLVGFLLAAAARSRSAANGVACLSKLHSIAIALGQRAREHGDRYPDPVALNMSWEQSLQNYISGTGTFCCPSDHEIFPSVGSSYDWRDTGDDLTTLADKTLHDVNRHNAVLTFDSLPGWHARGMMNAALVDGSAAQMDQGACLLDLQTPIRKFSPPN